VITIQEPGFTSRGLPMSSEPVVVLAPQDTVGVGAPQQFDTTFTQPSSTNSPLPELSQATD
jgi:hypothetical protein